MMRGLTPKRRNVRKNIVVILGIVSVDFHVSKKNLVVMVGVEVSLHQ